MEQNKLKNSLAQTRSIATGLVIAFAASSCSIEPIMMSEDIARNPTVATAPQVADSPFNAAVAWQVSSEDGDEEATQIFVKLLPDDGATHTVDGIISPTAVSHPVELVRAGEHYFLAWIDNTEPPARLSWRILSANDLTLIHEGGYGQEGKLVSDFAAAYHPEETIVLVAILTRSQSDAALDEYTECVGEDGISSCSFSWFKVDVDTGEISRVETPYEGLARGVSVNVIKLSRNSPRPFVVY